MTGKLYMSDSTTKLDVLDFMIERTADPVVFDSGRIRVYNYHNQSLDAAALAEWAEEAEDGVYVVPYQVSGVWAFMQRVLPQTLRDADLLAYRQSSNEYADYANWRAEYVDGDRDAEVSERVDEIHATVRQQVNHV